MRIEKIVVFTYDRAQLPYLDQTANARPMPAFGGGSSRRLEVLLFSRKLVEKGNSLAADVHGRELLPYFRSRATRDYTLLAFAIIETFPLLRKAEPNSMLEGSWPSAGSVGPLHSEWLAEHRQWRRSHEYIL